MIKWSTSGLLRTQSALEIVSIGLCSSVLKDTELVGDVLF